MLKQDDLRICLRCNWFELEKLNLYFLQIIVQLKITIAKLKNFLHTVRYSCKTVSWRLAVGRSEGPRVLATQEKLLGWEVVGLNPGTIYWMDIFHIYVSGKYKELFRPSKKPKRLA